jgi:hypothetical protein
MQVPETDILSQIKLYSTYNNNYLPLKYINITLGIISLISCTISILTYIIFKSIRSFIMEIILYLTISSFFQTLSYIIYFPNNESKSEDKLCQLQGSTMLFSGLSQFAWTCLLSFSIFQSVINLKNFSKKDQNSNLKTIRFIYIFIGFGIPLIITLIGLILDIYGKAGFWCFINSEYYNENNNNDNIDKEKDNKYKIFYIFFFSLLWFCILFNLTLYSRVILFIKRSFEGEFEGRRNSTEYTRPLISYSLIQILWLTPATVNRIYQAFDNPSNNAFDFVQSLFDVSQGFIYSLAFGLNPRVRKAISNAFKRRKNSDRIIYSDTERFSNLDYSGISILDMKEGN